MPHLNDQSILNRPTALEAILRETADLGFSMASESQTESLLRTLAASKPAGRFLELGTGTGVATAWLLAGMDQASRLESVDNDPTVVAIARRHLGSDPRVIFHLDERAAFIKRQTDSYDFVFADAWPGKFSHLEQALAKVRVGGLYFIDELLPQANWPAGHAPTVAALNPPCRRGYIRPRSRSETGLFDDKEGPGGRRSRSRQRNLNTNGPEQVQKSMDLRDLLNHLIGQAPNSVD